MRLGRHIILSFAISIILFICVKDASMMISCFIFGIFIDIDHLFSAHKELSGVRYGRYGWLFRSANRSEGLIGVLKVLTSIIQLHLIDFWILTGKGTRSRSELIETLNSYECIFIPLHSWELLIALMIFSPHHPAILGAAVGYFGHMITDYVYNHATIEGFSVIYRMNQNWRKEILFKSHPPTQEGEGQTGVS